MPRIKLKRYRYFWSAQRRDMSAISLSLKLLPRPSVNPSQREHMSSAKQCLYHHGTTKFTAANIRDVAIMFHSHNLSPFRFYADMMCRDRVEALWAKGIAFPLERLHHLITNGVWSDPDSEKLWNKTFPNTPYQLWNADPTSTTSAVLSLQNIEMACPWCGKVGTLDSASFRAMHVTKTAKCHLSSCRDEFTADSLSAKYLKDDLIHYVKSGNAW